MTDLSDTPAQQLTRIAELEHTLMDEFEDTGDQADMRWLCALARQGVEARQGNEQTIGGLTVKVDPSIPPGEVRIYQGGKPVSRIMNLDPGPQSPEGTV